MKVSNKDELQQIVMNHSSDINLKDFKKIYKIRTAKKVFFFSQ